MSVIHLYDGIYQYLANDEVILDLLEIDTTLDEDELMLQKALHIQRRSKPQDLAENIPLITFYTPGGGRDVNNTSVYDSLFVFDIYTKDDVEKALMIAKRLLELFDSNIPVVEGIATMESSFEDGHESEVDLQNTYCFTLLFSFCFEMK